MNDRRTVRLRIVQYNGTIAVVLQMTDGTSARLTMPLGEWSKAIGRPATEIEADCEMQEPTPTAA